MSDTQAAMREFRFLDDKRKTGGLSPHEEHRWLELGALLGMTAQQGYYAEDGAWYAYPPGYDPNTGQYYGGYQQPAQPPAYYDPNQQQPYYPPQQQGYDPNAPYYPPEQQQQPAYADPSHDDFDPLAHAYQPQQPAYDPASQPQQQWDAPQQPQWPQQQQQTYDPNTGQYYDPAYAPQPQQPQYPSFAPPAPSSPQPWAAQQVPAPYVPTPVFVPPRPLPGAGPSRMPAPAPAPVAEDGPLEVGEDEVMEVTDDDVTLLDSSPPIAPIPAVPRERFTAEKPLATSAFSSVFAEPAKSPDDLLGDLRSSLSFDEPGKAEAPAPPPPMPEPVKAEPPPPAEEPLLEASIDAAPLEPSIDVTLAPEPEPAKPVRIAEPIVEPPPPAPEPPAPEPMAAVEITAEPEPIAPTPVAEPMASVEITAEPIAAEPITAQPIAEPMAAVEITAEPVAAEPVAAEPVAALPVVPEPMAAVEITAEPEPIASSPLPAIAPEVMAPLDLPEPVVTAPAPDQVAAKALMAAFDLAAEPEAAPVAASEAVDVSFDPEPAPKPAEPEMPSIMVGDDLGAVSFDAPVKATPIEPASMLTPAAQPPPPPPPSEPDPVAPPMALTHVAPISATENDLYPNPPPPLAVPAPPPPLPAAPSEDVPIFDAEPEAIPEPRPSIPLSIQVEEPVYESAEAPLLEASVEATPAPAPELTAVPQPAFTASFDDLPPQGYEPEPPPSNHTGFEASLGDLPPAIANQPPPPIVDTTPVTTMDFDVAIDDKPVPVEVHMDLGGSAGDKVELAKTSDFLDFPATSSADGDSFSSEGQSLVENQPLATMANPSAPSTPMPLEAAPADVFESGGNAGDKLELASNSDFIGMPQLNETGEQWERKDTGLALEEEPVVEGEIIQGTVLEEDIPEIPIEPELELEAEWADPPAAPAPPPPAPAPLFGKSSLGIPPPDPVARPAGPTPIASMGIRSARPSAPPPPAPPPARPSAPPPPPPAPPPPARPSAPPPPVAAAKPFVPAPPPRPVSSAPFESITPGRDHSLFDTSGGQLRNDAPPVIKGEHRVILHTVEGQVKRGALRDANLGDDHVGLEAQPGAIEKIPRPRIKAIFFMLPAGQKAPAPTGDKLRVTFKDGRQLAGFSSDHKSAGIGFFVVPADNRTNTERIFIYRSSVEKVAVD